ncbi:dienelactone hydrolase family protein [Knoellia sp. Soil729]|uniref:dienelactone hydrolase family protein n=1 Tax=Knoellia sp. Soil729 TaxID=1736394 RepID=UPI003FA56DD6
MQTIPIPMAEGAVAEAFVARPQRDTSEEHPGVLLFMDAIGLRPRIAEMAQRIADWGYVVLAPNVFFRDGTKDELAPTTDLTDPGARDEFFEAAMPRVQALTATRAEADIPVYLETLRALTGVAEGPVGTVGYCMGARLAVRAANLDAGVAAVGGFHGGGLATEGDDSPHRGLADARAEFVFGHADQDRSMGPEAVARLGEALADAGLSARNEVYEGAAHGYTMSDTAVFDEAATERAFTELEALFARTLRVSRA